MSGEVSSLIVKRALTMTNSVGHKFLSGVKFGVRKIQKSKRFLTSNNFLRLGAGSNDLSIGTIGVYAHEIQGNRLSNVNGRMKRRQDEDVVNEFKKIGQNKYVGQKMEEFVRGKINTQIGSGLKREANVENNKVKVNEVTKRSKMDDQKLLYLMLNGYDMRFIQQKVDRLYVLSELGLVQHLSESLDMMLCALGTIRDLGVIKQLNVPVAIDIVRELSLYLNEKSSGLGKNVRRSITELREDAKTEFIENEEQKVEEINRINDVKELYITREKIDKLCDLFKLEKVEDLDYYSDKVLNKSKINEVVRLPVELKRGVVTRFIENKKQEVNGEKKKIKEKINEFFEKEPLFTLEKVKKLDAYWEISLAAGLSDSMNNVLLGLKKVEKLDALFALDVVKAIDTLFNDVLLILKEDREWKIPDKSDKVVLTKLDEEKFGDISKENTFGKVI